MEQFKRNKFVASNEIKYVYVFAMDGKFAK